MHYQQIPRYNLLSALKWARTAHMALLWLSIMSKKTCIWAVLRKQLWAGFSQSHSHTLYHKVHMAFTSVVAGNCGNTTWVFFGGPCRRGMFSLCHCTNFTLARYKITSVVYVRPSLEKWLQRLKTLSSLVCKYLWLSLVGFAPSEIMLWKL